ncbi:MAG: kynureninase [Bacteroidetes bacterium]|nr:kynureninase [Bacteroidota bacterium]
MKYENSAEFAQKLDQQDPLAKYRAEFLFPTFTKNPPLYFVGNSLGLQPKKCSEYIQKELNNWHKWGVEGHFHAEQPWFSYHEPISKKAAKIVGAKATEVVVTHSLTTNLHLLMVSFFQPKGKRTKIICEGKAFPSDQYALETQLKFHKLDLKDNLIEIFPRKGEHTLRMEDIQSKIKEVGDELALIMIGGVNYYTGQVMDMKSITEWGHAQGAIVGFDLAHAAGNIELKLNEWKVDFAAWCTYKYMNSSPGGVSGLFVHEKHHDNKELNRFAGWWGHNKERRFLMEPGFDPIPSAEAWQLSNSPILLMAAHDASLDLFDEIGMEALAAKRDKLTGYLEFLLDELTETHKEKCSFEIITPRNPAERGAQLSILLHGLGKDLYNKISAKGVVADWREPNVIRVAPAPMYNSYTDVYQFAKVLEETILEI